MKNYHVITLSLGLVLSITTGIEAGQSFGGKSDLSGLTSVGSTVKQLPITLVREPRRRHGSGEFLAVEEFKKLAKKDQKEYLDRGREILEKGDPSYRRNVDQYKADVAEYERNDYLSQ